MKSEVVTQLLYGDIFKKLKQYGTWIKIKNDSDNYKGFIKNKKFSLEHKNTHKVYVLSSNLYSKPNSKKKINKKLSFGSRIKVEDKKGNFYKFDDFWIKKNDVKKITYKNKDIFSNIHRLLLDGSGVPFVREEDSFIKCHHGIFCGIKYYFDICVS